MDQTLVRLPTKIPKPDFPLYAVAASLLRGDRQFPLRCPCTDRRIAGLPVIQSQPIRKARLARAAITNKEDFGVGIKRLSQCTLWRSTGPGQRCYFVNKLR